jgi:hypothetical protein
MDTFVVGGSIVLYAIDEWNDFMHAIMFWPFKRNTPERRSVDAADYPEYSMGNGSALSENVVEVRIAATSESMLQPTDCMSDGASGDRFGTLFPSETSVRAKSSHKNDSMEDNMTVPTVSNATSSSSSEPFSNGSGHEKYLSTGNADPSSSLASVSNANVISQDDEGGTSPKPSNINVLDGFKSHPADMPLQPPVQRDRSMRVIWPPKSANDSGAQGNGDPQIIRLIKLLDRVLALRSTQQKLDEFLYKPLPSFPKIKKKKANASLPSEEDRRSVRFIQADRYEIFVQSRNKSTEAFDWLCLQVWNRLQQEVSAEGGENGGNAFYPDSVSIKSAILAFAIQQAERDDRISTFRSSQATVGCTDNRKVKTSYDNFSLITIYEPVTEQQKHIDLLFPNFQYGLIITDQSPGTNVYRSARSIKTTQHIRDYVWTDMSDSLCASMDENPAVTSLVEFFGDVLCPNIQRIRYSTTNASDNEETFPTGTLLCLPGSEIHAGPACDRYRTVLFFSACPDVSQTIPYHPDTQYFAPLVCCDIISAVWGKISFEDRYYLLSRLVESIQLSKMITLERHLFDPSMQRCVRAIVNWDDPTSSIYKAYARKRMEGFCLYDYLWNFATMGRLATSSGIITQNGLADIVEPDDLLSIDGLVVEYNRKLFRAQIYKRSRVPEESHTAPPSVVLEVQVFYPIDQSWEGQTNPYTLEWNPPLDSISMERMFMRFDGINGILRDEEGTQILCFPNFRSARMARSSKQKARKEPSTPLKDRPQRNRHRPPEVYTPSPLPYKAPRKRVHESSSSDEYEDE